jgi:hypothetical protein
MLRGSHTAAPGEPVSRSGRRKGARKRKAARAVLERPPAPQGWRTSDAEEIELRRWRGRTEILGVEALESEDIFGAFRVRSDGGSVYEVEIRSIDAPANSCGCIDHRVNGLGTCKHIEGTLEALRRRGAKALRAAAAAGSPRVEVFLDRREARPAVAWPAAGAGLRAAREWLAPFLTPRGGLREDPDGIAALVAAWPKAPAKVRRSTRVSRHFGPWLERQRRLRSREEARAAFLADVESGKAGFDVVRSPLLPYQREGMLHLAFGERALLADEMGLGKTVQAIAACELLAQRKGIGRRRASCRSS